MSNTKISALTSATTPLAGTEVVPIVQSGVTKQVSVTNLTAGRSVTASRLGIGAGSFTDTLVRLGGTVGTATTLYGTYADYAIPATTTVAFYGSTTAVTTAASAFTLATLSHYRAYQGALGASSVITTQYGFEVSSTLTGATNNYGFYGNIASGTGRYNLYMAGTAANYLAGTTTIGDNLVIGTSGKGVDFSANTPAAGKTSTLLNWYEEGTFTPNQGAGLVVVGTFSSTGKYVRVGKQVTVSGTLNATTSIATTSAGLMTTNLPFSSSGYATGVAVNSGITASVGMVLSGAAIYSSGALAASSLIFFSVTYNL